MLKVVQFELWTGRKPGRDSCSNSFGRLLLSGRAGEGVLPVLGPVEGQHVQRAGVGLGGFSGFRHRSVLLGIDLRSVDWAWMGECDI